MKRLVTLVLTLAALLVLAVTAGADTIPGTATCTITPADTQISGDTATVTYSVTVTPPEGKELGVFSVQLQPSEGMTIAKNWKDSSGKRVISVIDDLSFNKYQPDGVFATYEYTPQTGYFAAVGTTPERRMSKEATILTIQATMPANKAGTYTLGAEFIAALDGSGDVYTGKVVTNAVTVSGDSKAPAVDDTPVITETNADTLAQGNDAANTPAGTDGAANGSTAADGTADTPAGADAAGDPADADLPAGTDGASGNTSAGTSGAAASSGGSAIPWIILALAVVAIVLIVVAVKKKKH